MRRMGEPKLPLFFKLWVGFVAMFVILTFIGTGYVIYGIAQAGPDGIGREIGRFIKGVDEGRR